MKVIEKNLTMIIVGLLILLLTACHSLPASNALPEHTKTSCQTNRDHLQTHEALLATLWVQTSAEYFIACHAIYRDARTALDYALANPNQTAALEQQFPYSDKPPAVILDIDETVFDNSPFQAQMILDRTSFTESNWNNWVLKAKADWVPGAKEFLEYAVRKNVTVFFVTNRTHAHEYSTRDNFSRLGFSLPISPDRVLTRNERSNWQSDKKSRRAHIAENYRIVLLLGDDLNDFVSANETLQKRADLATLHIDRFGKDWFLLPNPVYGSWERALSNDGVECDAQWHKQQNLKGF